MITDSTTALQPASISSLRGVPSWCVHGWKSRTVHRRKKSGHSISVPYATIELLRAEAQRRGTSMRALVEGYTKDCK